MTHRFLAAFAVALLCSGVGVSHAQNTGVQIVIPLPAASPTGEIARRMGQRLAEKLGQHVTVEYKPGGNSRVAQEFVRNAKPDGSVLLWSTSAILVEPVLAGRPQDVAADLQPLALSLRASLVMVARPGLPQRSFAEVLTALRSGAKLSCGYGGGAMLLACSALKQLNPEGVVLVAYASSGLALPDVVGERLDVAFTLLEPGVRSLGEAGKLRLLGRTGEGTTAPAIQALPRLDHALPALAVTPWQAWFAPVGTAPESTRRFLQAAQEVLMEPELRKLLDEFDFRPDFVGEPQFSQQLATEYQRYAALLKLPAALR